DGPIREREAGALAEDAGVERRRVAEPAPRKRRHRSAPDRNAARAEVILCLPHGVLAVVEQGGDERRARAARREAPDHVRERPPAARRDDRDADALDDGTRQLEVVAEPRAVAVHAREQDLARPSGVHPGGPLEGIEAGPRPPAVREDL